MNGDPNTVQQFNPAMSIMMSEPASTKRAPRLSDRNPTDPAKLQEKREKARERQRRKRFRDKQRLSVLLSGDGEHMVAGPSTAVQTQQLNGQVQTQQLRPGELSPEEIARRERVRAAARDRQRKHRMLVKQKKMAELGLTMGGDPLPGLEDGVHYALGPDGQYQAVMQQAHHQPELAEPFPQGHTGGQTFASTLLLSFSCSPLLKQHLLRTLHMTNEELASLEPILSAAWDQWDHARRLHYAEQAAKAGAEQQQNGAGPSEHHFVAAPLPPDAQAQASNDFRARFARPLTAPSPFRTVPGHAVPAAAIAAAVAAATGHPVLTQQQHVQQQQALLQQQLRQAQIDPSLAAHVVGVVGNGMHGGGQVGEDVDGEDVSGSDADMDADSQEVAEQLEKS